MTTAYAPSAQQECTFSPAGYRVSHTAPAQGREALKVRQVVRGFTNSTAARGQSVESGKVFAFVGQLQSELVQQVEELRNYIQSTEDFSYNHIPIQPIFSVKVTYKHIGKLKPRRFPLDE